jgi:hypothetical protein
LDLIVFPCIAENRFRTGDFFDLLFSSQRNAKPAQQEKNKKKRNKSSEKYSVYEKPVICEKKLTA